MGLIYNNNFLIFLVRLLIPLEIGTEGSIHSYSGNSLATDNCHIMTFPSSSLGYLVIATPFGMLHYIIIDFYESIASGKDIFVLLVEKRLRRYYVKLSKYQFASCVGSEQESKKLSHIVCQANYR